MSVKFSENAWKWYKLKVKKFQTTYIHIGEVIRFQIIGGANFAPPWVR